MRKPVASLDLCANSISDEAAMGIADKLSHSGFLKRLLVDAAYLSDVGRSILSNALSKSGLIFLGGMRQPATSQVGETSAVAAQVSSEAIATWQVCRESLLPANTVSRSERLHLPPPEAAPQSVDWRVAVQTMAINNLTARKRVVHPDILKRLDDLSQRNHDTQLLSRQQYTDQNHHTAAYWDVSFSYRPDVPRRTYSCGSIVFDPDRVGENFELRINWGKQIDWMLQNIANAPRLERAADLSPLRASDPLLKL